MFVIGGFEKYRINYENDWFEFMKFFILIEGWIIYK